MPVARQKLGHVPELDGLRGIAVLLVVMSHVVAPSNNFFGHGWWADPIRHTFDGGWLGVDIFFVLSGFLITSLLLDAPIRFGRFYGRRATRLLPALYVLLVMHAVWAAIVGLPSGKELRTFKNAVAYWTDWQTAWHLLSVAFGLGHLWSLAIEEQFYIVWPVALFVLLRYAPRYVGVFLFGAIGVVMVHRVGVWNDARSYFGPFVRFDTRADSLMVGCLLAWLPRFTAPRALTWCAFGFVVGCVWHASPDQAFWYYGGFTLFAVAVAVLIASVLDGARMLTVRPLVMFGVVSYGLYLWHVPVFKAVSYAIPTWAPLARFAVALAITTLATWVSRKVVERPAMRLRRYF